MTRHIDPRSSPQRVVGRFLSGDLLVITVIALGPIAMAAGLIWTPEQVSGPNAALSGWLPVVMLGAAVPGLALLLMTRPSVASALPFAAALVYGAVSLLWAPDAREGAVLLLTLAAPLAVFVSASRSDMSAWLARWVRRLAMGAILTIGLLFVLAWALDLIRRGDLSRLMGITTLGLPPLFVIATLGTRSTLLTLTVGGGATLLALAADARMVALVMALLAVTAPSLDLRGLARVAFVAAVVVLVVGLAQSDQFERSWFFFNRGGSISSLVERSSDSLAGRQRVWSELVARCDDAWVTGNGLGASNVWGAEIEEAFTEPHNEYVRTTCDLGVPAAAVFWSFFALAGAGALRRVVDSAGTSGSGIAALQLLGALALLGLTDVPLTAVAQFHGPLALVLAWSEMGHSARRGDPNAGAAMRHHPGPMWR